MKKLECCICKVEKPENEFPIRKYRCKKCLCAYTALGIGRYSENNEIVRRFKLKNKLKKIRLLMPKTPYEIYLKKEKSKIHHNTYRIKKGLPVHKTRKQISLEIKEKKRVEKLKRILLKESYKKERLKNIRDIRKKYYRAAYEKSKSDIVKYTNIKIRAILYRAIKITGKKCFKEIGFNEIDLINHLGKNTDRKNHIDHKIPISWFKEKTHSSIIHNLNNLHVIDGIENVKKHNKYCHAVNIDYYNEVYCYIKKEYRDKLIIA